MKRLVLPVLLLVAAAAVSCTAQSAPPAAEATPEIVAEVTPEVIPPENPSWVTVTSTDPTAPAWELQHPDGWEIVRLNQRNIFLDSEPGASSTLFANGLRPGQVSFQISINAAVNREVSPEEHLRILTETLRGFDLGEITPFSAGGLDGVQLSGVNQQLGLTIFATSRPFLPGQFFDIFAYSRLDEYQANRPLIDTVIESVRYVLATE